MDTLLYGIGFIAMLIGIAGSFLPVIPGPPISWLGLFLLFSTKAVPDNWTLLSITLIIAILIFIADYIIPSIGTKKFGGTKFGVIGTSIGLVVGILAPIPFGIIIGPFLGAFTGELLGKANPKTALKAAFGSLLGFIASTFIKACVTITYFGIFLYTLYTYREHFF